MVSLSSIPTRWPRTIVAAFVLVALAAVVGLTRLREEEDLLVFLPTNDRDVQLFKDVSRRFGGLRVALIGTEAPAGEDVFTGEAVRRIAAATEAVKNVHGVDRVASMTSLPDVVAGPMGAEITPLVAGPPKNDAEQRALREKVLSREAISGSFVSRDARAALILVFLAEGAGERAVTDGLRAAAHGALSPFPVYYGGAPFAARTIYEEAQTDVWKLSPVALAILLLVVILSFRDPVGVVLTIVSVAFSVLVVMGGMGFWGEKFTVASSTLPVILFASGSSYAVHVLGRYYLLRAAETPPEAIRGALRIVGPPLLIAAGTTAVGFYSFVATDVRPMRAFGIACGSGVLLCWFTSLTLVPAVVAIWPRQARPARQLGLVGDMLVAIWSWARRHRRLVVVLALGAFAGLSVPMFAVQVRMEPRAFFRKGSEPWLAEQFLEDKFGGAHFIQIALEGDFDDPATEREVARLSDYARSVEGVTQIQSVLDPLRIVNDVMGGGKRLPSTSAQAANLYFFIEGEPGMQALIAPGRTTSLVHVRVRGDARHALVALEKFVAERLRAHPPPPAATDAAERIAWVLAGAGRRDVDLARLTAKVQALALPADGDADWVRRRAEVARAFFAGEDAPPLAAEVRTRLAALVGERGAAAEGEVVSAGGEDGDLAWRSLAARLDDERRTLAVARAVEPVLAAAGASGDVAARARPLVSAALDDLFTPAPKTQARAALSGRVAGEPVLDRGFSRSVERNQIRSLVVSIILVLVLLLVLFRSLAQALVCMAAAMLTMVILFGVMGALGMHIDLGTSLIAGIATGAGSDFAMHYMWYLRSEPADRVSRTVGPVMVVSVLLVSLGFMVLALGRSPVMRLFGNLAGLAMSLSALLTCLLIPALLNKVGTERPNP